MCNTSSESNISSKAACGKKLFIEVTGLQHGLEQDFQFYDSSNNVQQEYFNNKKKSTVVNDTTIYSWCWKNETEKRNVWLKVETDNAPIKLPLFNNVSEVEGQLPNKQHYLIQSVLPLTVLPTYNSSIDPLDRLAPVRFGYIYIFYNKKVWREIQVKADENEQMSFSDVDLYSYRSDDQLFAEDERIATGKPLKELWIPVKDNSKNTDLRIAFSEVQWSAPYLNYLEKNDEQRKNRAVCFHSLAQSYQTFYGNNFTDFQPKYEPNVLQVSKINRIMPLRAPELELFIAEPSKLSEENWLENTYQAIKGDITKARDQAILKEDADEYKYEYTLKQSILKELVASDTNETADNWKRVIGDDFLADAKKRHLRLIVLDDPLFDLRHSSFIAKSAIGYLQQVYVDMSQQEHYRSAELVTKIIMPEKLGNQENPLNEYKDEINEDLEGRFHRTLRSFERSNVCQHFEQLQQSLNTLMNKTRLAQVLRDVSSLNDINASAAHVVVGSAISVLSNNIRELDQLSPQQQSKPSPYIKTVNSIFSDKAHPLHLILFPDVEKVNLDGNYTPPTPFNNGSGYADPESLALWGKDDWQINDEQIKIIDLSFMLEENSNGEGTFNLTRRVASIVDGIFREYFEAALKLHQALLENAQVVNFNAAYAPLLGVLKASNSKYFGDATYQPVGGKEVKGIVVGVEGHGLKYGLTEVEKQAVEARKNKAPMGRLYIDGQGKLAATTGKNAIPKGIARGEKLPLKVVMVSEGSELAKELSKARIQRTLHDLNDPQLNLSNAYEVFKIPYFMVVIELINLKNSKKHFENLLEDKVYSGINITSIVLDFSVAIVHALNLYTKNASRLATASGKTAITMPARLVTAFTFIDGRVMLERSISRLGVASIGAGFLTAGIAAWDSFRLWQKNDVDAAAAMAMVATGTLVTTVATGLFTTSAPLLFGMGPVAWFGIALAVTGLALFMLWKDTPIEEWLKNGPFNENPETDYQHLQDAKVAFNRLIGILFNPSAKAYCLATQTNFAASFLQQMAQKGATHVIHIDSNLAQLFGTDVVNIEAYVRQAMQKNTTQTSRVGVVDYSQIEQAQNENLTICYQQSFTNGKAFFVKHDIDVPKGYSEWRFWGGKRFDYSYQPVFLLRARMKVEDNYFPTPPLDEVDPATADREEEKPKFNNDDKLWINQIVTIEAQQ